MLLRKVTTGFVVQVFDTKTKRFVSQEFVAGDECEYEDETGDQVESDMFEGEDGREVYLEYEMKQPNVQ